MQAMIYKKTHPRPLSFLKERGDIEKNWDLGGLILGNRWLEVYD
jgi:hypothetical protein